MKSRPIRNLTIVGDFFRYTVLLFVPLVVFGVIYGLIYECYLTCFFINPLVYSTGISLIIIVIIYDVNDIMDLFGLAHEPQIGLHIKHVRAVQEISLLMGTSDFRRALEKADKLTAREPDFAAALNMKGEILLEGFQNYEEARECFDRVLSMTPPGDEQHKLAEALKAATYPDEE
jgi:tetratricopeptide (TPR) repeat protein